MKATFKKQKDNVWIIDGARVSFPSLWEPGFYDGAKKAGLDTSFLIDQSQAPLIKKIKMAYLKLANSQNSKIRQLSQLKDCKIKDLEGGIAIQTNNQLEYPPIYYNYKGKREANPLAVGADKILYAGCYAKIKLTLRVAITGNDTKVWIQLAAIRFSEDGDRLGGSLSSDELDEGMDGELEGDFDEPEVDELDDSSEDELGLDGDLEFDDDELELD